MHIHRNLLFVIDREKGKPNGKLRFRIKWHGNTVAFNVGFRVELDRWSSETQRCKANTTHGKRKVLASVINKEIQHFYDTAEQIFTRYENEGKIPATEEFRNEFNQRIGKYEPAIQTNSFIAVYDEFIREIGLLNSWSGTVYGKHNVIKAHLLNFDPKISLNDITEKKLIEFIRYQQSPEAMKLFVKNAELGMKNATIEKNITTLKSFLRWAKKQGYYHGNVHEDFNPRLKHVDNKEIIYLTWDELIHLYNFHFEKPYLDRTRDVFCFCCFSSLRYSDVQKLQKSDIKEGYMDVVTTKTAHSLKIELNKYTRAILEKYRQDKTVFALPVVSNPKMNLFLKEMSELAGINEEKRIVYFIGNQRYEEVHPKYELITTHTGRRTFIVNSLFLGIPVEVVMKWTGHSDYKEMKPYIEIVDELKQISMRKFDEK
jgi:integrase